MPYNWEVIFGVCFINPSSINQTNKTSEKNPSWDEPKQQHWNTASCLIKIFTNRDRQWRKSPVNHISQAYNRTIQYYWSSACHSSDLCSLWKEYQICLMNLIIQVANKKTSSKTLSRNIICPPIYVFEDTTRIIRATATPEFRNKKAEATIATPTGITPLSPQLPTVAPITPTTSFDLPAPCSDNQPEGNSMDVHTKKEIEKKQNAFGIFFFAFLLYLSAKELWATSLGMARKTAFSE